MTVRDMPRPAKRVAADAALLNPDSPDRQFTIGELAEAFGVTTRAIRFYETKGLISPPRKGKARTYSRRERGRLKLIQQGKNLGFSLEEIREWLELYDADPNHVMQAKVLIGKLDMALDELGRKRADIDRALKDMREIRQIAVNHLKTHED